MKREKKESEDKTKERDKGDEGEKKKKKGGGNSCMETMNICRGRKRRQGQEGQL